jgi:hypothetical protein
MYHSTPSRTARKRTRTTPYDDLNPDTREFNVHINEIGENQYRVQLYVHPQVTPIADSVLPGNEIGKILAGLTDYINNPNSFKQWLLNVNFIAIDNGFRIFEIPEDVLIGTVTCRDCTIDISCEHFPWPVWSLNLWGCDITCGGMKRRDVILESLEIENCTYRDDEHHQAFRDFFDCVVFTVSEEDDIPTMGLVYLGDNHAPLRVGEMGSFLRDHPRCIGVSVQVENEEEGEQLLDILRDHNQIHAIQAGLTDDEHNTDPAPEWLANLRVRIRQRTRRYTPFGLVSYEDQNIFTWAQQVVKLAARGVRSIH